MTWFKKDAEINWFQANQLKEVSLFIEKQLN